MDCPFACRTDYPVDGEKFDLARNIQTSKYYPGKLVQEFRNEQLSFVTELCFLSSRTALIRSRVDNTGGREVSVSLQWRGGVYENSAILSVEEKGIRIANNREQAFTYASFPTAEDVRLVGTDSLLVVEKEELRLSPGGSFETASTQTFAFDRGALDKELEQLKDLEVNLVFSENEKRWNTYLSSLFDNDSPFMKENKYRRRSQSFDDAHS